MRCDFERVGDYAVCQRCGVRVPCRVSDPTRIFSQCQPRELPSGPTLLERLANFSLALAKHIANGGATCSQEQIDERFEHCKSCALFNGEICTHLKCGCNASDQPKFLNKLSWASESCPLGKWVAVN